MLLNKKRKRPHVKEHDSVSKYLAIRKEASYDKVILRDAVPSDFDRILGLNEAFVQFLSPLSLERLGMLHARAVYHRVLEESGRVIAFLIAFREGAEYDSPNYRWFADRYSRFVYIDRVVVDGFWHDKRLASKLYADLFAFAQAEGVEQVVAEIDSSPPNPVSERFHAKQGFVQVGSQFLEARNKSVGMVLKTIAARESKAGSQSLVDKFAMIHEHWRPKVVAELNGQEVKLVKFCGEFPWHHHEFEDEMFLVWRGEMTVEFRDRIVLLSAGEFCVVPKGVEHRTVASNEAEVILFEPAQTRNTGNVEVENYTAPNGVRI